MDVGKAINFVFEDEQWVSKLLLGAVITLIPIFGQLALMGYVIAVTRNVKSGAERPLPTWDNLGEYFVEGLMFWIASLIYALPLLVIIIPIAVIWILPALGSNNDELVTVLAGMATVVSVGLGCLGTLYAILLALLMPVLQIRYADTGELAACLRFGEIFRFLFDNIGSIIIAQLIVWVAGLAVSGAVSGVIGVLSIIPICGWIVGAVLSLALFPAGVWLMYFSAHLYGQIANQAEASPSAI